MENTLQEIITTPFSCLKSIDMEQKLLQALLLILPFQVEEIEEATENCGTVWIVLKNGKVYALSVMETEPDQLELDLKT